MSMFRILILCVTAAILCAMLRTLQPQLAAVAALATGVAALLLSASDISVFVQTVRKFEAMTEISGLNDLSLLKACAVAMIAEFASDICRDAGELALAHRIDTGVRLGLCASALPIASQVMQSLNAILSV